MNLSTVAYLLVIGFVFTACDSVNEQASVNRSSVATQKAQSADSITINETLLSRGSRINASINPLTRQDAKNAGDGAEFTYKADTLTLTDNAHVLLISRLYAEETIGWLVTISRADQRLIDSRVVYYDNAEGMSHTEAKWLPNHIQAVVLTGTYNEAGAYHTTQVVYKVMLNGKLANAY